MAETLTLKWGTLKGWDGIKSEKSRSILQRYLDIGASYSVMTQHDTPEQKQLICELIDSVDGEIWNDWDGKTMGKDEAKNYVTTYGEKHST